MAATSRKPSKAKLATFPAAQPRSKSKQTGISQAAWREQQRQSHRVSTFLRQISDPTRLEVILILAEGEHHVGALCDHLSQSQPAVSHHLALLRHAHIIEARRQGARNYYGLTEKGRSLAGVVHSLFNEGATKRPLIHARPGRASGPSVPSPRSARKESIASPKAVELRTDSGEGSEEETWGRMNHRRAELIFKKNRGHLSDAESSELERLQTLSRSRMLRDFPPPTLIDEKLKRIEEHLRGDGAEKA